MAVIALCDCDNFFVSCERITRPGLARTPAVVLSSNDGCVIARSAEVKAMGIKMGEPYFRVKAFLRNRGVAVFSGNLPYYKSVSDKVMAVLRRYSDLAEQYSIDEAFLNFGIKCVADRVAYAREIREAVRRFVGVPISIGIAPSKTLAKLASKRAKQGGGVCELTAESAAAMLEETDIGDIWGVGRQTSEYLRRWGVRTAADFARRDPIWVKDRLKSHGAITQMELKGVSCIPIDPREQPPKSVQSSHAFGRALTDRADIARAIIEHAIKAGRIMRGHGLAAKKMSVFLLDGYISKEHRFVGAEGAFERPANDDAALIRAAMRLFARVFSEGRFYTRAGIVMANLADANYRQKFLFDEAAPAETEEERERRLKNKRASDAIDRINSALGRRAIYPAALAVKDKPWKSRGEMRSPDEVRIICDV